MNSIIITSIICISFIIIVGIVCYTNYNNNRGKELENISKRIDLIHTKINNSYNSIDNKFKLLMEILSK